MTAAKEAAELNMCARLEEALRFCVKIEVAAHHKGSVGTVRNGAGGEHLKQRPCENAGPAVAIDGAERKSAPLAPESGENKLAVIQTLEVHIAERKN
eukprot:1370714-Alexandrium_andersonii.AAC.1